MNALPLWLILAPLGLALLAALTDKPAPRLRSIWLAIGGGAHLVISAAVLTALRRQGILLYALGGWAAPWGIGLRVDDLTGLFLAILSPGLAAAFCLLIRGRGVRYGEAPLLFLLTAAAGGMLMAADLFNLFVFVELATVCTAVLLGLKRGREQVAAGFNYLVYAALSSLIFLAAIILIYGVTGHLSMPHVAARIERMPPMLYRTAAAGIIAAFGVKIGMVPLHFWQPRAYTAAGSTMAGLFSGVLMKVYLYAMIRLLWQVLDIPARQGNWTELLLAAGMLNVLLGHIMALAQNDLKRLLAFSSVAHAGYILMGLGAGSLLGMLGALYHAVNHCMMKTALFWAGRDFIRHAGSADMRRFQGAASAAPWCFAFFFIGALTIVGVPPTGGFNSKWMIALAVQAQYGLAPVLVIAAGTLISMIYYARIFHYALRADDRAAMAPCPAARGAWLPPALMAAGCVAAGPGVRWLLPWLERAAATIL